MTSTQKAQSNPFSTGGGGVNFETRVQASFIIAMLTQSIVPCLPQNMCINKIEFQSKYNGNDTDDLVLFANDAGGIQAKLLAQIKHSITIIDSDSIFAEVIKAAWEDFNKNEFNKNLDSIVLVTGLLPSQEVQNTLPILEWAKYSASAEEFIKKSNTEGFTSKKKLTKLETFRTHLNRVNNETLITNEQLWQFLKIFNIISYDFESTSSTHISLLSSILNKYSSSPAHMVWSKIITTAQTYNQMAGTLSVDSIPSDLKAILDINTDIRKIYENDIRILNDRSSFIHNQIQNVISDIHVDRSIELADLLEKSNESNFIFVTGSRGIGKSGIVKDFVNQYKDIPIFYFRAEDFDKNHISDLFSSFGMKMSLDELAEHFALIPKKILVIESLEKVLELSNGNAFSGLLDFINPQTGWIVITTCRDYAYQKILFHYIQPRKVKFANININEFNSEQVDFLALKLPKLQNILCNKILMDLTRNPFFIELANRVINKGITFDSNATEQEFRQIIWEHVIANSIDRNGGMPAKRRNTFIDIATTRAKKMLYQIPSTSFDAEVIDKLEADNLLEKDPCSACISIVHDVLEDWALEEFINEKYQQYFTDINEFLSSIGNEPAISRAFRMWIYQRIRTDRNTESLILDILNATDIEGYWKDETIAAILQSENPSLFLELKVLNISLFKNDCALLIRFFFILRIACQIPRNNDEISKQSDLTFLSLRPYGNGWDAIIKCINKNKIVLPENTINHIIELLTDWSSLINQFDELPSVSKEVYEICIWLLEPIKSSYHQEENREKVIRILLKSSVTNPEKFNELMAKEVLISKGARTNERLAYVRQLTDLVLFSDITPLVCKYLPRLIYNLAIHEWHSEPIKPEDRKWYDIPSMVDANEAYGLIGEHKFYPPSALKGPFWSLLCFNFKIGLNLIIELCNKSAVNYSKSEYAKQPSNETLISEIELTLNDKTIIKQFASPILWKGYRGSSVLPYLLQSALMALENWLIAFVENSIQISTVEILFDYLLRNSNSVMITSVLTSIAVGFPKKIGNAGFPFLGCQLLYSLDMERAILHENSNGQINWFAIDIQRGNFMAELYAEERKDATLRPWRKLHLESLLLHYQLDANYQQDIFVIIDMLTNTAEEEINQNLIFMLNRSDIRKLTPVEDKENNRVLLVNQNELPNDLKSAQLDSNETMVKLSAINSLWLWSNELIKNNEINSKYFSTYKDALFAAQELWSKLEAGELGDLSNMAIGGITKALAMCVLHDYNNLDNNEKNFCNQIICSTILHEADTVNGLSSHDVTDHNGSAICAYVLPILFKHVGDQEQLNHINYVLAVALTHQNANVRRHAANGIREILWLQNSKLAHSFLIMSIKYAKFENGDFSINKYYCMSQENIEVRHQKIEELRHEINEVENLFDINQFSIENLATWYLDIIMSIIPIETITPEYISIITKIVEFVVNDEFEFNSNQRDIKERIHYEIIHQIAIAFAAHLVHCTKNKIVTFHELLRLNCEKAPHFTYSIKLQFDVSQGNNYDLIWEFWSLFIPELHKIASADTIDSSHEDEHKIKFLTDMLLTNNQVQNYSDGKQYVEPGACLIIDFAKISGGNIHIYSALSRLMYHFQDLFFENGIIILKDKLLDNPRLIYDVSDNVAFCIEMSISNFLQITNHGPLNYKIHTSCLILLNAIVERGSVCW